jgi:hypothetical protein
VTWHGQHRHEYRGQRAARLSQIQLAVLTGVQHELLPRVSLNVGYFRTNWYNFTITDNLAVTAADFDSYCVTVPTDSRLPLSGQSLCGLYAVSAAKFSVVSTNNLIMRASDFGTQTDVFNGVDVTLSARLPNGGFVTGGTSTGREAFDNCYAADRPDLVPLAYTMFEDRVNQLDLRLTKTFRFSSRRFQANLDLYNALNGSGILNENTTYGPNWKRPTQILDGRMVKFGGQLTF